MLPLLPLLPPGCPAGQSSLTMGIPLHEVLFRAEALRCVSKQAADTWLSAFTLG